MVLVLLLRLVETRQQLDKSAALHVKAPVLHLKVPAMSWEQLLLELLLEVLLLG